MPRVLAVAAVAVEEENPGGTTLESAAIVASRSDGQIGIAVAIEVARRRHGDSEEIVVVESPGEAASVSLIF